MARAAFRTGLPEPLAVLAELALDLRWTWSHAGDDLWRMINAEVWERTRNPWTLLQDVSRERLETLAQDRAFREELRKLIGLRERYLSEPSWYAQHYSAGELERVAYFSMEFGVGEACRSTPAASASWPATTSRRRATSACRRWGSGSSTRWATFVRSSMPVAGSTRCIRTTSRPACPIQPVAGAGRRLAACLARFSRPDDPPARVAGAGRARGVCICWTATTR